MLQLYALLYVCINGLLQADEQKVDVRFSGGKQRVYVRWAVPEEKLEWDGAPFLGQMVHVGVCTSGGDTVIARDMRLIHWAVRHEVSSEAVARAIFEI